MKGESYGLSGWFEADVKAANDDSRAKGLGSRRWAGPGREDRSGLRKQVVKLGQLRPFLVWCFGVLCHADGLLHVEEQDRSKFVVIST